MGILWLLKDNSTCILLCLLGSVSVGVNLFLREQDVHYGLPSLSMYIPAYITCFCISAVIIKAYHTLKEEPTEQWSPMNNAKNVQRVLLLAGLTATSLSIRNYARHLVQTTESAWTLDVWTTHIPFWSVVMAGLLNAETLVFSLGTSLAMTSGCVLMLPLEAFRTDWIPHVLSFVQTLLTAACLVISHGLLNVHDDSTQKKLSPYHLTMNISVLIPIFLFLSAGFGEVPMVLGLLGKSATHIPAVMTLAHGVSLFAWQTLTFYLFQKTPLFFGTVVYCLGSAFAFLSSAHWYSMFGFFIVSLTFVMHIKTVYSKAEVQ